ncbi:hypothetical protein FJZ23_00540 [Candidatus Parcubacteria bacterium]|nr:hypothetical protein [Candidatus Parcubacteria bacterium]
MPRFLFPSVLALLVVIGFLWWGTGGGEPSTDQRQGPQTTHVETQGLTAISCAEAGGTWNPCGSACREDPEAVCIQVCVEFCECAGAAECPDGYACGGFVEGTGVCKPVP